jgi:hypothetical protein
MRRIRSLATDGSEAALVTKDGPVASMSTQGERHTPAAGSGSPTYRIATMAATTSPPPAESPASTICR